MKKLFSGAEESGMTEKSDATTFVYEERTWPEWWYQLEVDFRTRTIKVQFLQRFSGLTPEERQCSCRQEDWKRLMELYDVCRIADWMPQYEAPVLDGTSWNVTIRSRGQIVKEVLGCNAWPENWEQFAAFRAECFRLAGAGACPAPEP